ncbi:MAG: UDP-glucose/GDP-mannose dehydrogenase family protein [Gammaproteobacteria bacterium]|nr:UDP-glucose/GDP-mannose dehydrogenase family protein [Gammaproteobacteria bacterium]
MKVTVFGTGYVGLVQGAVLADNGHQVVCVDVDEAKVEQLKQGVVPIYEPGLETIVKDNILSERLQFTTDPAYGVRFGQIQFIAVGTPSKEDGGADLTYVLNVAETIATHMDTDQVIVNKSTVPVGTAALVHQKIESVLNARQVGYAFDVVSNPEFLKEGMAVSDCQRPDRIVIGTSSKKAETMLRELYAPFNRNHDKVMVMDACSAELTKYAANCMLATKISFMNEIAILAENLGADIESIRHGIGSDHRIGYHFIYPGIGYGGSCFPKDIRALINMATQLDIDAKVLKAVELRNQDQKLLLFRKMSRYFSGNLKNKVIALWGLSFKPNTDDIREAPSLVLIDALLEAGAVVQAYDPAAMKEINRRYGLNDRLILMDTKEQVIKEADALAILTEWHEFRSPDFELIKRELKQPVLFDGRNLYEQEWMRSKGFTYFSIGRGMQ